MLKKTCLLLLLCLVLVSAKKKFDRLKPSELISTKVSSSVFKPSVVRKRTDLTMATIKYNADVELGKTNKVEVITNPPETQAAIYMNVTDVCDLDLYNFCEERGEKYLSGSSQILLKHEGKGVYTGNYTINRETTGEYMLTFYTLKPAIAEYYCDKPDFTGECTDIKYISFINPRPLTRELPGGCKAARWRGKWVFPQTRNYDLKIHSAFSNGVSQNIKLYLDGALVQDYFVDAKNTEKTFSMFMQAGDHDFTLEQIGKCGGTNTKLRWKLPANGGYKEVSHDYFRSVDSVFTSEELRTTTSTPVKT